MVVQWWMKKEKDGTFFSPSGGGKKMGDGPVFQGGAANVMCWLRRWVLEWRQNISLNLKIKRNPLSPFNFSHPHICLHHSPAVQFCLLTPLPDFNMFQSDPRLCAHYRSLRTQRWEHTALVANCSKELTVHSVARQQGWYTAPHHPLTGPK